MRKLKCIFETGCIGIELRDGKGEPINSFSGLEELLNKIFELQLICSGVRYVEFVWDEEAHYE